MTLFIGGLLLIIAIADGPVPLAPTTEVRFASPEEGRSILTADDVFTATLSRFDLQCRLKTDKDVTLADWKQFVAKHVRAWEPAEVESVTQSISRLQKRLEELRLAARGLGRLTGRVDVEDVLDVIFRDFCIGK